MNILITGSNGFVVGSTNVGTGKAFIKYTVIGIDISEQFMEAQKDPETMLGDIRSLKDLNNASSNFTKKHTIVLFSLIPIVLTAKKFVLWCFRWQEYFSHNKYGKVSQNTLNFTQLPRH